MGVEGREKEKGINTRMEEGGWEKREGDLQRKSGGGEE